jgi:hypothetical protein
MKNIFTVTLLSVCAILLATACTKEIKTPADMLQQPNADILQKQMDFDKAMIEKKK